jgi:hypothetical protein
MRFNLAVVPTIAARAANLRTTHGKEYAKLYDLARKVESQLESSTDLKGYKGEPETWAWQFGGSFALFGPSIMHPDARAAMEAVPAYDGTNADAIRAALEAIYEKASFAKPAQYFDPADPYKGSKVAPGPWRPISDNRKDRAEEEAKDAAAKVRAEARAVKEAAERADLAGFLAAHPEIQGLEPLEYVYGGEPDLGSDYGGMRGQKTKVVGFYSSNRREDYLRAAAAELFKAGVLAVDLNATDSSGYRPRWSDYSHDLGSGYNSLKYARSYGRSLEGTGLHAGSPAPRRVAPGVYVLA